WRTKMREPTLRARVVGDVHAPGAYRALTVRNIDPWYEAFDVEDGPKLYLAPDARVRIWCPPRTSTRNATPAPCRRRRFRCRQYARSSRSQAVRPGSWMRTGSAG